MNIVAIIQARMASERFPGKVLEYVYPARHPSRRTVIEQVSRRARSTGVCAVVVATHCSRRNYDIITEVLCETPANIFVDYGDENDVLGRYARCAEVYKADVIVRVTGDCPLVDPTLIDAYLPLVTEQGYDWVIMPQSMRGLTFNIFNRRTLDVANAWETSPYAREHVGPAIRKSGVGYEPPRDMTSTEAASWLRLEEWPRGFNVSVDTPEDLERVRGIYSHFNRDDMTWREILDYVQSV